MAFRANSGLFAFLGIAVLVSVTNNGEQTSEFAENKAYEFRISNLARKNKISVEACLPQHIDSCRFKWCQRFLVILFDGHSLDGLGRIQFQKYTGPK